jgi:hypothetical protein
VLNINSDNSTVVSKADFQKFTTVLINTATNLDIVCPTANQHQDGNRATSSSFWTNATYDTFADLQMTFARRRNSSHNDVTATTDQSRAASADDATFTVHMLTAMLSALNDTGVIRQMSTSERSSTDCSDIDRTVCV